jgi:hypothetical protein
MNNTNLRTQATPILSRVDHATAKIVETAVHLVLIAGLEAAERYLEDHGVPKRVALRVLTPNRTTRRQMRFRAGGY